MKKLILIRHGKSSWEMPLEDHERPLTNKGIKIIKQAIKTVEDFDKNFFSKLKSNLTPFNKNILTLLKD